MNDSPNRAQLLRQRWRYIQNHREDIYREFLAEVDRQPGLIGDLPGEARLDCASVALSYLVTVDVHATADGWPPVVFEPVLWELQKVLWLPAPEVGLKIAIASWTREVEHHRETVSGVYQALVSLAQKTLAVFDEWDGPTLEVCRGAVSLAIRRLAVKFAASSTRRRNV